MAKVYVQKTSKLKIFETPKLGFKAWIVNRVLPFVLMGIFVFGSLRMVYINFSETFRKWGRPEPVTFEEQVEQLESFESELKALQQFVTDQKTAVQNAEAAVKALQNEQQRLDPIVQEKRETVESILVAAESEYGKQLTRQWWWGLFTGVAGSLITVLTVTCGRWFFARFRSEEETPPTED